MPGNVKGAVSVGTFPVTLSSKFTETHGAQILSNEYHDGTTQRSALVNQPRRSWKLTKRLTVSQMAILSQFWQANRANAFFFYDPYETSPPFAKNPAGTAGQYTVCFASDWDESINMIRSDAQIELIEVADATTIATPPPTPPPPSIFPPMRVQITVKSAFVQGSSGNIATATGKLNTISIAFGNFPFLSTNSSYGASTQTFDITNFPGVPTTQSGFTGLTVLFFIGPLSGGGSSGLSSLLIYDVFVTVTWQNLTTQTFRPGSVSWDPGASNGATITNQANAIDTDVTSFAQIDANTWGPLVIPGALTITNFT